MPYKDPVKRKQYARSYGRMRRAGLTKNKTCGSLELIKDKPLRLASVKDYLELINDVIADIRSDPQSSRIQQARTVGYLVNIALKALELGAIEERIEQLEATVSREAWR